MKTIKSIVGCGIAVLCCVLALGAQAVEKTAKWSLPSDWDASPAFGTAEGYAIIRAEGAMRGIGEVGAPDLPAFRYTVTMPKGGTLKDISVDAEWKAVDLNGALPSPVAAPVTSGQQLVYPEPGPAYAGSYPAAAAYAAEAMLSGNKLLQPVVITPFRWDGSTKTLFVATKLDVTVTYTEPRTLKLTTSSVESEGEVLILSPHDFVSLWQGYAAFRKSTAAGQNFRFIVKDTKEIYDYPGLTDREKTDYALALHHYIETNFYKAASCDKQYIILGASPAKTAMFNPNTMIPKRDFFGDSGTSTHDYNQAGDMYYGCMERLKNGAIDNSVEVWDYGNDGVYWAAQNTAPYNFDPNNCVDWTMEIAVTRVPLLERSVETLNGNTIEVTAAQMMDAFTNRIAWAESVAFETADRGKAYVGGNENEGNQKGGKDERYTGERQFFDGIANMFDPSRNGKITSDEWGPRDRIYNIMGKVQPQRDAKIIANNINNTDVNGAYSSRGDLATFYSHGDWREYGNLSASRAYQGGGFYAVYSTSFSCMSGKYDTNGDGAGITNALCFGEAPIVAPVKENGALVTLTSARDGWSGGFGTLSMYLDELFLKALYGLADGVPMNMAQAGKYAHNTYAQSAKGTTSAHGSVLGHAILCGDPLIKVFMMPDRTTLTGYSQKLSIDTSSSKTFNISTDVAAARAAFSDAGSETLTLQGTGKFRTTDTLAVTNVANLVWNVAGGAGRNGIAFVGQAGRLTLPGNAVRYFGPKLTNVGDIAVTGGNVTLDFDTTACSFDKLEFVAESDTTANPNVLSTRKEGFIPAAQTIPVVNSALKLQTINVGGSNAALKETPLFYVTNGVLTVESNPYWGTEYFVRPTYLSSAKLLGEYADFGLGRPDSNGYDLYVDGASEIGGSTPIKVTGELRLHLEDAATTLTLTNALANGHNGAAGSVVVSGAGKVVLATSPTLTGGMTIEGGIALELPKIPLTSGGTITLESGAKLLLPEPSSSGIYNVYSGDAKLVLEDGVKVCKASAPDTEISGRFVNGNFIPNDAVIYWKATSGTWQNSASVTTCWTNSSGQAVGFTNGQSVFFGPVASSVSVTSSGVNTEYAEINAPGSSYSFSGSAIVPNLLTIASGATFTATISNAQRVSVTGGTTYVDQGASVSARTIEIAEGGTFKIHTQSRLDGVGNRTVKALAFSFSESRSDGNTERVAIQELRLFQGSTFFPMPTGTIIEDCAGNKIRITGYTADANKSHTYEWITGTDGNESLRALIDGVLGNQNKWWASGSAAPTWFTITFPTAQSPITGYNLRTADSAGRNPKSWTVQVSEDGTIFTLERSQSGVDFSSTGSWMGGDGTAKAYDLMTDSRGVLHVKKGGTLVSSGNAYVDVTFDEGAILKLVGGKTSLFRPTAASYCFLNLPENGGVYVSSEGLSASSDNEVLYGYNLTDADKAKFTPADNMTLYVQNGQLYANIDSKKCSPFKATISADTSWTTLSWTDCYGDAITWDSSLQYLASSTATLKVDSLPANGATFDVNYTPALATMKLVGGSTETLTLKWTVASVPTLDLSEYAGRVILVPNGNIASTVTIIVGTDTVLDAMCEASFTIGVGKQLTVRASGLKQTQVTNNGTIVFEGGSEASPIEIFDNGPNNNTGFGAVKLMAGTVVCNKVNNNRIHTVTGEGVTSVYKVYRGSGFGTTTGTQFRNLTFVVAETGSTQCWIEREGSFDATVDVRVDGGAYYLYGYSPTIGSLLGSGSVTRQNSQVLTITPSADADYSGASSVEFTIAASEFTQTLSGNYTGTLTVNAGGKVALGASAHPSSIVNSGMVTVAGDQLTCALTLNAGATINITTPGEPTADSYAITSGTFTDNGGTVRINGNELGSQWHVENGCIVRSQAVQFGPLMSELWHQHNPYDDLAPVLEGEQAPCGCVATATAQMFHYYAWPKRLNGVTTARTTYKNGSGNYSNLDLAINGYEPFDYAAMNDLTTTTNRYQAARFVLWCDALAQMQFNPRGVGSNTPFYWVPEATTYWYEKGYELNPNTDGDCGERIKAELAAGRPVQTTISGHQVVIDGWRSSDNKFHVNWGQQNTDPEKTTYYTVSGSVLGEWQIASLWLGLTPRILAQLEPIPSVSTGTVTLNWDFPAARTNEVSGFKVRDYVCASAASDYNIADNMVLDRSRADYYPIPGAFGLTASSEFSCTVKSSYVVALDVVVQMRLNGGDWQDIATPELSREESYEDKGVLVDKTKSTVVSTNLAACAGSFAEFRFKTIRTGNSVVAPSSNPYLYVDGIAFAQVKTPGTPSEQTVAANVRTATFNGLATDSCHAFTVTPLTNGVECVTSEAVSTRIAAEEPTVPEIVGVTTMGSPITDGFKRTCKPGGQVYFVQCSEDVTSIKVTCSHVSYAADSAFHVINNGNGNFVFYVEELNPTSGSQMLYTIAASDANGNTVHKDLQVMVSQDATEEEEGWLIGRLTQDDVLIVSPGTETEQSSDFDRPVVGLGTITFHDTAPTVEQTTLLASLHDDFAWHGTVKLVDCPKVENPGLYKNDNSFLVEETSPTPVEPESPILVWEGNSTTATKTLSLTVEKGKEFTLIVHMTNTTDTAAGSYIIGKIGAGQTITPFCVAADEYTSFTTGGAIPNNSVSYDEKKSGGWWCGVGSRSNSGNATWNEEKIGDEVSKLSSIYVAFSGTVNADGTIASYVRMVFAHKTSGVDYTLSNTSSSLTISDALDTMNVNSSVETLAFKVYLDHHVRTVDQIKQVIADIENPPGPTPTNAAKIGETEYETVAAAIDDVTTGQTITLLKNCSEASLSAGDKTFTLDLGSHSLTGTLTIGGSGAVTLTTLPAADTLKIAGSGRLVYDNATIPTLNNIWDSTWTGTFAYGGCNTAKTNWDLTSYYNGTNSKFEFNGTLTGGYFAKQNWSLGDFIVNGSITFDNGYSTVSTGVETVYTFKALKGTGSITTNISKVRAALRFDTMDDFTGSISLTGYRMVVGTSEFTIAEADPANSTITLLDRANLTASTLTATAGIVIKSAIGGTTTFASNATFGDGAEIDNRNGTLNANGTLTFGASTKVRVATIPADDVKIINKSGTTEGDISTTVSAYVGSSETPETREYKLAYKTDGVYLIPGESPYAKFAENPAVLTYNGAGTFHTAYFVLFDIVGGTNTTTSYNGNASSGTIIPGQTAVIDKSWKVFSANSNTANGKYVAPGYVLRFASGIGTAQAMDADFDPLSIGGMVVESGATGWSFASNKGNAARATQLGDNRATGGVPTWFVFNESFAFNRYSSGYPTLNTLTLWGEINFEIAEGKTVSLNTDTSKGCPNPVLDTTTHAQLKMHGAGTLAANLNATGAVTLDYSNIPLSRETAYISGALTINDATVIKLPEGLPENTAFKMATTLSGANNGDRTIWIGETEAEKYVTFDAANGTISYADVVPYKTLGWDASQSAWTNAQGVATAVDNTCILNAKDGDVITFASAVTPHQFNMPETGTVTLNDQQNLSVSTIAIPSAATLVFKANNTFSPALTGSGTLSVNPGQVKFNGQNNLPASKFASFTGKLQMASGRLQDYSAVLPSSVTIEILNGAQMYFGTALTWENNFIFKGNGWTGESNVWIYGPARFDRDVTLSGSVTFDRDNAAPQILIASGKTLTLSGAVSAPHGFTTAGSSGTVKLTTVANDTIAGTVTLNTGDLWYGTGSSGGTAGTSYKCGDTIIVKTGRTFNLHPWTTTQTDDSESNKVILASDIDMQGGTFHVEDGSYVFSGDFNVSSNSTLSFKWAKGRVIKSLKGGSDVTLTVNSANSDKTVSKNYFKGGDFAGTLKLTGGGTGAYCIPYGTALATATVLPESGWNVCLMQDATIGSLNGGRAVFGEGSASPTLTLKAGAVSGNISGAMGLTIDGIVTLAGENTYTGTTTVTGNGTLTFAADTQRTLASLVFGSGAQLVINTNATDAAVAVTSGSVDLTGVTISIGNLLSEAGGTVKLVSATGGISNWNNAFASRGSWTVDVVNNVLTATKAKANYIKPSENGTVTDAGNATDSLDISRTLAINATKNMPTKVTDSSTASEVAAALNQVGANTYRVWESIVLGLDPTNANDQLVITPIQTSNANMVTLKVPTVNVDTTTGADVTFCFWAKDGDGEWTEVQGGAVNPGDEKELRLPTEGVRYYNLRTTIKVGTLVPVPVVIPSANVVEVGMPVLPGTGSLQYAAELGTKTLDSLASSLTVELEGSGVYEGQQYHLEITEPANAPVQAQALKLTTSSVDGDANDETHFCAVARATSDKTLTFNFSQNAPAGSTCKLTLIEALTNGNVAVKSGQGFGGIDPIYANAVISTRVGWLPHEDGLAKVASPQMPQQFRIPAIATDGQGEVIACYDCRYGKSDLGAKWDSGNGDGNVFSGIDIAENYSDNSGVSFDSPTLGVDVPNMRDQNGNWVGGYDSRSSDSYVNKTNDLGDVCLLFDPAGDGGKGLYWMMGMTGGGLTRPGSGTCNADVVLYTRKPGKDSKWTEWDNGGSGDHWEKRSVKWQILDSLGVTTETVGSGFLEGPGHGIVTTKSCTIKGANVPAGTLVFPIQCFLSDGTKSGAAYSTDHGATWKATALTDTNSAPQENCVMELDDGTWYMCTKCNGAGYYRTYRYNHSTDEWVKVENGAYCPAAREGSCVRMGVDSNGKGRYAICHARNDRANIVVYFGVDTTTPGETPSTTNKGIQWDWNNYITIHKENTSGGYSSMCMVDDTTLGILYESSYGAANDGGCDTSGCRMYFTRIDVSDKVVAPAK